MVTDEFKKNVDDIDSIFTTSKRIKKIHQKALKKVKDDKGFIKLSYKVRQSVKNFIEASSKVTESSIAASEEESWSMLYSQGITLIVSAAEQQLKTLFDQLLKQNLSEVENLDKKEISLKKIRERNFNLDQEDWFEVIRDELYSENNPSESLNFQNMQSIQGIFEGYFNINLDLGEDLRKRLHKYYQIRHIILHNNSKVDQRFLDNLEAADISTEGYNLGEQIILKESDYKDAKEAFMDFFEKLQKVVLESDVEY